MCVAQGFCQRRLFEVVVPLNSRQVAHRVLRPKPMRATVFCSISAKANALIYVVAELRLKPGTSEKAAAEARKVVAGTVKEDGCLSYDFHLSVSDPTLLVAVERWTSPEHLAAHMKTPHLQAWREAGKEFVVERAVHIITPEKVDKL